MTSAVRFVDAVALARDAARLVRVPSLTGDERAAAEEVVAIARVYGLEADLVEHDLGALRAADGYPGEEAPRSELVGAVVTLRGTAPRAPRLCLNGHVDVVHPGTERWRRDPWSGAVAGGKLHGRGSADMKGGVIAALHALVALRRSGVRLPGDVVLQAVSSEEDGGLGSFAALERDDRFAACLIPEPTELEIVCAHAGALTFTGTVRGTAAHAALRLEGVSAIDRYLPVHAALHDHERAVNATARHPLLADHPRGQFAPGETPLHDPWVGLVRDAAAAELGARPPLVAVTYGADMRLFCARGIPCVLLGPRGLRLAHAVDEHVAVADLASIARIIVRSAIAFAAAR